MTEVQLGPHIAIASILVLTGREPLRVVARGAEGDWMFLSGTPLDELPGLLVSVHPEHLLEAHDQEGELRALRPGHRADRLADGDGWDITVFDDD